MFRNLISRLPFQPSLLEDVARYTRRLKKIARFQLLALAAIGVSIAVQAFGILILSSGNTPANNTDLTYGSWSKDVVISAYTNNKDALGREDIKAIYERYGIKMSQIQLTKDAVLRSTINNVHVVSRLAAPAIPHSAVSVNPSTRVYEYLLSDWAASPFAKSYPAISGLSEFGYRFWILLDGTGNIAYQKTLDKPQFESHVQNSSSTITAGEVIKKAFLLKNSGNSAGKDIRIQYAIPAELEYQGYESSAPLAINQSSNTLTWAPTNNFISANSDWGKVTLIFKANRTGTTHLNACGSFIVHYNKGKQYNAPDNCVIVVANTCPGTGMLVGSDGVESCMIPCPDGSQKSLKEGCSSPQPVCTSTKILNTPNWHTKSIHTFVTTQKPTSLSKIEQYINGKLAYTLGDSDIPDTGSHREATRIYDFAMAGDYSIRTDVYDTQGNKGVSCSQLVAINQPQNEEPLLVKSITSDQTAQSAKPGSTIKYTLNLANVGNAIAEVTDVNAALALNTHDLDVYGSLSNPYDGTYDAIYGKVTWIVDQPVEPGASIQKSFEVTLGSSGAFKQNTYPNTPLADGSIDIGFGNIHTLGIDQPLSHTIQNIVRILPNEQQSLYLVVSAVFFGMISLFYIRSLIMIKELDAIQREFKAGGI